MNRSIILLFLLLCFSYCKKEDQSDAPQHQTKPSGDETLPIIKFLVTADPQYNYDEMNPDMPSVQNSDEIFGIVQQKLEEGEYKGLLIAGDLSHNARFPEIERYQEITKDIVPYLYDGLGNHDFRHKNHEEFDIEANQAFGFESFLGDEFLGWDIGSLFLFEYIRSHPRNTPINSSYPNIHYSWDWEDIHFVHLNLYPGNEPRPFKTIQNPFKSFDFLKQDLETHVGDSERPVILIHHYGFDDFSIGLKEDGTMPGVAQWWSVEDRDNYMDLLENYNVMAIFSGHAHNCSDSDNCFLPWDGANIGSGLVNESAIPSFIAGSAREGFYLDIEIRDDQIFVNRYKKGQLLLHYEVGVIRKND